MNKDDVNKICCIFNYAPHYRKEIYILMDKELECDFIFGDNVGDIQKMDYSLLYHFKKEVQNKVFIKPPLYWQKGIFSLLKENYTHFIITGESICVSTWLLVLLLRLKEKKIYFWSHGWSEKGSKIRKFLTKRLYSMVDHVFLYGNHAKKIMIENGFNGDKLHIIYNSLAYDEQMKIRNSLTENKVYKKHFQNDFHNLIFIGRLTKIKQLDKLLIAIFELNKNENKYNLTFIGNGEMQKELEKLAQKLQIENNVWFYGATYDEKELSELIYNADLCVSPGNVGLTAMHAMTYGCPIFTHNSFAYQMPEFEAIIAGQTGDFFIYNDVTSLIQTIDNWFKNSPLRDIIREKCYEIIDTKYNPHLQIELIKKVINNSKNNEYPLEKN